MLWTWIALWRWSVALATLGAEPAVARLGAAILGGSGFAIFVLAGGMEVPLALALLAEVLRCAAPLLSRGAANVPLGAAARLRLWASLAVLARLDHGLLLLPLGLLAAWRWRAKPSLVAAAAAACALTMLPYLCWNVVRFGALLPVSGVAKQSHALPWATAWANLGFVHGRLHRVFGLPGWSTLALLAVGVVVVAALMRRATTRLSRPAGRAVFAALAVGAALHAGYWLFFMLEVLVPWHLVGFTALVSAAMPLQVPRRAHVVALLLVAASTVGWIAAKRVRQPEPQLADPTLAWSATSPTRAPASVEMSDSSPTGTGSMWSSSACVGSRVGPAGAKSGGARREHCR